MANFRVERGKILSYCVQIRTISTYKALRVLGVRSTVAEAR
jgi:hypothetical protein